MPKVRALFRSYPYKHQFENEKAQIWLDQDIETTWTTCPRASWMVWILIQLDVKRGYTERFSPCMRLLLLTIFEETLNTLETAMAVKETKVIEATRNIIKTLKRASKQEYLQNAPENLSMIIEEIKTYLEKIIQKQYHAEAPYNPYLQQELTLEDVRIYRSKEESEELKEAQRTKGKIDPIHGLLESILSICSTSIHADFKDWVDTRFYDEYNNEMNGLTTFDINRLVDAPHVPPAYQEEYSIPGVTLGKASMAIIEACATSLANEEVKKKHGQYWDEENSEWKEWMLAKIIQIRDKVEENVEASLARKIEKLVDLNLDGGYRCDVMRSNPLARRLNPSSDEPLRLAERAYAQESTFENFRVLVTNYIRANRNDDAKKLCNEYKNSLRSALNQLNDDRIDHEQSIRSFQKMLDEGKAYWGWPGGYPVMRPRLRGYQRRSDEITPRSSENTETHSMSVKDHIRWHQEVLNELTEECATYRKMINEVTTWELQSS